MRGAAAMRLPLSVLGAALVHGVAFAVAAVVFSRETAERPAPPPRVDVDVVEVAPPRPEPVAVAAPALVRANLVTPAPPHHRPRENAPAREAAPADASALVDRSAGVPPGPALPASPVVIAAPSVSRAAPVAAPSAGAAVVGEPRYRIKPRPDYPLPSLRRHEEGTVLLDVVVQPNGIPSAVTLHESCGYPLLDRAALDAVRAAMLEPSPASRTVVVPIRFALTDGP